MLLSTGNPSLSVIVVVFRMRREAPRTLHSLSHAFQRSVGAEDYEVVVVENRSGSMLTADEVMSYGPQFRYVVNPGDATSPAAAANFGASQVRGRTLMLIIDGARIVSPGVLRHTLAAQRFFDRPVVATLAWHLGPDNQARSVHDGYDQFVEDELLVESGWDRDGYKLFEISTLAGSSALGWFLPILESNCIALDRAHFLSLGGFSEEFRSPGGGFVNLDFYEHAVSDPQRQLVILLGEGTFHQVHGGVATNRQDDEPIRRFQEEYRRIRGRDYVAPKTHPMFLGGMHHLTKPFRRFAEQQARKVYHPHRPAPAGLQDELSPRVHGAEHHDRLPPSANERILAVVGMHRSGTSCLAGTLMECGVEFGQVSRQNRFNAKGNNENQAIMDLHDRILADSGGTWKNPPAAVRWQAPHRAARDAIIAGFRMRRSAIWGFKDPRTLLVLDGWREALPHLELVGIFRHPDSVAQSMANRSMIGRKDVLALWSHYNRRLLALHRRQSFPIIFFSEDAEVAATQLDNALGYFGLTRQGGVERFYQPDLRHFPPRTDKPLTEEARELFSQLHDAVWQLERNRPGEQRAPSARSAAG